MATNQADETVEEQAQPSAVPTEEQKGQEVVGSQEVVQETEETLEAPAGETEDLELPKGVSERTSEQFEKLKAQLRDARQAIFRQTGSREYEGEAKVTPLYDPATGLVNLEALTELQQKAFRAENIATGLEQRLMQQSQDTGVRELYEAHPELKNPKSKEAKAFFDESERLWLHSQAYPEKYGGLALTQKQAADLAKKKMGTTETPAQEAQRIEAKEQASFGASGKPTQGVQSKVTSEEEQQKLQYGTRIGDANAMVARMKAIRQASEAK